MGLGGSFPQTPAGSTSRKSKVGFPVGQSGSSFLRPLPPPDSSDTPIPTALPSSLPASPLPSESLMRGHPEPAQPASVTGPSVPPTARPLSAVSLGRALHGMNAGHRVCSVSGGIHGQWPGTWSGPGSRSPRQLADTRRRSEASLVWGPASRRFALPKISLSEQIEVVRNIPGFL